MATVEIVRAGIEAPAIQAGDFFLVHGTGPVQRLIQVGQRWRFSKEDARWNHAGLFINTDGGIIEALTKKITQDNISKYKGVDYFVVHPNIPDDQDRKEMVDFATWALTQEYGFTDDLSLAFWCIFGGKFFFGMDDEIECAGLVARSLERAGYVFDRDPSHVMPADLAKYFKVHEKASMVK
jgi:hypothetical protein